MLLPADNVRVLVEAVRDQRLGDQAYRSQEIFYHIMCDAGLMQAATITIYSENWASGETVRSVNNQFRGSLSAPDGNLPQAVFDQHCG